MVFGLNRFARKHESAVAIAALDLIVRAYLQEHLRVTQRSAAAVARDAALVHNNHFGSGCRHGNHLADRSDLGARRCAVHGRFLAQGAASRHAPDARFRQWCTGL
jgi:hypothetical protein